ncbi:ECF-type sigma factor [Engelhardtia mirabilis]|uniref:RNA polymerase sigma factor SigL n=1 Tax=Engelhardtia mirabilis TaxID=2528011 RepID=A0A518BGY6_9BACT|nr:RNA polymerase sigma factor SigL [Planctomycetes bacterium Pla133]QDV00541.1 RNA polymerase sigma factor SigL [Planctomycetes bacterium Pla86]
MTLPNSTNGYTRTDSQLYEVLAAQLKGLASASLRRQAPGHTLQTTALVHDVWLRLLGPGGSESEGAPRTFASREHFLALGARAMRSVLVDHARRKGRDKRGGDRKRLPIEDAYEIYDERSVDLVELDDALRSLAERDARQARVVELRFFGGLTIRDVARALEISEATVERDWRMARIWLLRELGES